MTRNISKINALPNEHQVFLPPAKRQEAAYVSSIEAYGQLYAESMDNMETFWARRAKELVSWSKEWDNVLKYDFNTPEVKWFEGGKLNVSYNCLDRHIANGRGDRTALIWQGEPDEDVRIYTYEMLHREVCRFANVLKSKGIKKGDRVAVYLPMIPEMAITLLACTRIGAVHSVIFAGFSSASLQDRIQDCDAKLLITADAVVRAGKALPLKPNADEAMSECPSVAGCIVVNRAGTEVSMTPRRDSWWQDEMDAAGISDVCPFEEMDAEDILFILYTSGSTGKPKGVVHTTGGYLTYALHTCQWVFDLKDEDVYWCTADIGWITGHSYILYGPLGLGATSLMFEGVPTYPGPDRFWQVVEKYKVSILYTAPTVVRALMSFGSEPVHTHDISSLRLLGSVGEPMNPEAWNWFHQHVGKGVLPIVDTWWQTETGGIMISPLPYATPLQPGSVSLPLPGVDIAILNEDGKPAGINEAGRLVIRRPWPGILRGIFGDKERYKHEYFNAYPGKYDAGDGSRYDESGYYWILGRLDDVINVSGHRLGTAEIESALVSHHFVAEAAVVGMPHAVKGQAVYAFVTVNRDVEPSEELLKELRQHVRKEIGPIASPEVIQYAPSLPKTRSGKIMRRVLRKIAADDFSDFGDTSTLANPHVISQLINTRNSLTQK